MATVPNEKAESADELEGLQLQAIIGFNGTGGREGKTGMATREVTVLPCCEKKPPPIRNSVRNSAES